MAKKTVLGRACKNFINSSDDANLTEVFNNTSENEDIDKVSADVAYDLETKANTEEFVEAEYTEVEAEQEVVQQESEVVTDEANLPWNK